MDWFWDQIASFSSSLLDSVFTTLSQTSSNLTDSQNQHTEQAKPPPMETPKRCILLELPAEIRLRIYEYALAPTGTVTLTSTRFKRFATDPVLAPALLATCRQIHNEAAEILYDQNAVCICVDAHDTTWPTISKVRLPQRVLEKLRHLFVVLDCTSWFRASYTDVDFRAFTALTSLQTLRIAILARDEIHQYSKDAVNQALEDLLTEIFERIPASTKVRYGTEVDSGERRFLQTIYEAREQSYAPHAITHGDVAEFTGHEDYAPPVQQGSKSGSVKDVYAEFHEAAESHI